MNQLAVQRDTAPALANPSQMMLNIEHMNSLFKFAQQMATAVVMVPKHLHDKPADCLAIVMQAAQWGLNPFVVAQKTHLVNGTLGYEAQLVLAVLQSSGMVTSRPFYEYRGEGQNLECRVGFVLAGEAELTFNEWLRSGDVQVKNSPLWKTNPKQQLGYLQVKNFARLYCPAAILGVYTPDELPGFDAGEPEPEPPVQRGPRRKSEKPLEHVEEVKKEEPAADAKPADGEPAASPAPAPAPAPAAQSSVGGNLSTGQVAYLRNKLAALAVEESSICARFEIGALSELSTAQFDTVKAELLAQL